MDVLSLLLVVLLLTFLFGGMAWPRPAEGPALLNTVLYILAVIVIAVLLIRVLGALLR